MHRQFTSNGIEREVSRWLKELGYRGSGLRREVLTPLCRGELAEIWTTLMSRCRSENQVQEIRKVLNAKIRQKAANETWQRSQEEKKRLFELRKDVEGLTAECKMCDEDVESLKLEIQRLQEDVLKSDTNYHRNRALITSKYEKAKILQSLASKTEEIINGVQQDIESLQKHVALIKKHINGSGNVTDKSKIELESILHLMYEFTQHNVSERVRQRDPGVIFTAEELLPKIDVTLGQDPRLQQLYHGIGQLYAHQRRFLNDLFFESNEEAWIKLRQYEMKYSNEVAFENHPPIKGIEQLQIDHAAKYLAEKQRQRECKKQKNSTELESLMNAIKSSENAESIQLIMELECLRFEMNVLEHEMKQLRLNKDPAKAAEVKDLYLRLVDQIEHSKQMDVLLLFLLEDFRQMQKSFQTSKEEVENRWKKQLIPSSKDCCFQLESCKGALSSECKKFIQFNLYGRTKFISLGDSAHNALNEEMPLLQRLDLTRNSMVKMDSQNYWPASLTQLFSELKHVEPCLAIESPERFLNLIAEAMTCTLTNTRAQESIHIIEEKIGQESTTLCKSSKKIIVQDEERDGWVHKTVDDIDHNLKEGHTSLHKLQNEVEEAFVAFRDMTAFASVPWYERNGKTAKDWILHLKGEKAKFHNVNV